MKPYDTGKVKIGLLHFPRLSATEANAVEGPFDDHGLKSMEHYHRTSFWLGFALAVGVAALVVHFLLELT